MEKTADAVVVPLDAGWSDVGSWASLHAACERDDNGNTLCGDVLVEDTEDSYVYSESRLVTTVGVRDTWSWRPRMRCWWRPRIGCRTSRSWCAAQGSGRYEHSLHREVFRPWGSYDSVDNGERFQVKRLMVRPGGVLSLQMHHHRAEHWVVVSGTAAYHARRRDLSARREPVDLHSGRGAHRIENPGRIPLHIIEVQSGSYLGEDDIVRFEDRYGRQGTNT